MKRWEIGDEVMCEGVAAVVIDTAIVGGHHKAQIRHEGVSIGWWHWSDDLTRLEPKADEWEIGNEAVHEGNHGRVVGIDRSMDVAVVLFEGHRETAWLPTNELRRPETPAANQVIGVATSDDVAGYVQVAMGVDPSPAPSPREGTEAERYAAVVDARRMANGLAGFPAPSVSVEVSARGESARDIAEGISRAIEARFGRPRFIGIPIAPSYAVNDPRRQVDTTPPTQNEARHAVADTLGVSPRYVTDEMVDAGIARRSAQPQEWAGALEKTLRSRMMQAGAEAADDAGYLLNRYGVRPRTETGPYRAYTINVPPGVQAEFRFINGAKTVRANGDVIESRWGWDSWETNGTAATLSEACDAVDEAIRKEMAEKPEREPLPMRWIGTGDLGGPGTGGHR